MPSRYGLHEGTDPKLAEVNGSLSSDVSGVLDETSACLLKQADLAAYITDQTVPALTSQAAICF